MEVKKDIMWRIYGTFILICVMGIAILVQIVRIQFVEGDYWKSKADSTTTDYRNIEASRGSIFSDDGSLLATSVPIYDVRMDMAADAMTKEIFDKNIDSLSLCLSQLFSDKSRDDYKRELRAARAAKERYYLLQRNVHYLDLMKLKTFPLFRLGKYKGGLLVEQRNIRELPFKNLAARTIGYQREVKPVGVEAAFNNDLKGAGGKRLMQRIAGGVWMPLNDKEEIEPKDGDDLITTLDVNIQDVAEHALEEHMREHNADHGCAVLMEVETGEVKAIANLSRNKQGEYNEDYNYAIAEATDPGSTMKLASLLAAMDDGLVDLNDEVEVGNGKYQFFGQKMEDSHAPHKTKLSVKEAFMTSSNVGISKIIYKSYAKHPEDFIQGLKDLHLNEPLGLQIQGEGNPRIKNTTDKDWSPVSLPWISIGYETQLTPLQILTLYNAIANNGRMVKPKFVNEIRNHGQVIKSFPTEIIKDSIVSASTLAKARKLLEAVVDSGTASSLRNANYRVAGKTGTAQIFNSKYGYDQGHRSYQASFVGYFPADHPKYSCMVVIYAPSNDVYFGGAVSAPVFKEIADKVFSTHLDMHQQLKTDTIIDQMPLAKSGRQKDLTKVFSQLNLNAVQANADANWVSSDYTKKAIQLSERKILKGVVPNVIGMGIKDAIYLLENAGLNVRTNGRGFVTKQSLDAGIRIQKGQQIIIELS